MTDKEKDKEFLKYRIHSVSSEAESGSTLKIIDPHQEEGWVSAPNSSYPQYIVIQFFLPVKTSSLSLLFHQYKIPSLVEIFVKERSKEVYQRLGYLKPINNQQTRWEQRQLKTIYFEYPCSFIKIVFHQPYQNRYNILKQVAIDEVTVKGTLLDSDLGWLSLNTISGPDSSQQDEQLPQNKIYNHVTIEANPSTKPQTKFSSTASSIPQIQTIFETLQKKKDQAVEQENYQLASVLKAQINRIKQMQARLFELQISKKRSIENQDYDQAALLKNQISKLKQNVYHELSRLNSTTVVPANRSFSLNSPQPNKYYEKQSSIQMSAHSNTFISQHQSQIVSALANKIYQSNNPNQKLQTEGDTSMRRGVELKFLEQLDSTTQKQILKYEHIIPLSYWEQIVGKDWKTKQKVLDQFQNFPFQSLQEIIATLHLLSFAIRDKHPTIIQHTLSLILKIVASGQVQLLTHIPQSLTSIIQQLPAFLIDNNIKVRELSLQCFIDIPDIPCISLGFILSLLVAKKSKGSKQIPKLTQAKLVVVHLLFNRYKFTNEQTNQVLEWSINFLEDPNQDVRSAASQFILDTMIPIFGSQFIKGRVKNIRPNALNNFLILLNNNNIKDQDQINDSRVAKNSQHTIQNESEANSDAKNSFYEPFKEKFQPPRMQFQLEKELKTQRSKNQDYQQQQVPLFQYQPKTEQEEDIEGRDLCDYCKCKLEGPDYDKSLEEHLSECKMITACEECQEFLQIRSLCDHLLHQCERAKYHQCNNCGLAFPFGQLHSHKAEGSCKPRKKGFQRCQMCGRDVPPNQDAWIAHADFCR